MPITLIQGDARALPLPDESVDLIVTSPPYFALRSYSDGGEHYVGQIGSEATPAEFIAALVECTREMVRVLKPTGSIFVNLGDKYNSAKGGQNGTGHTTLSNPVGTSRRTTARDIALAGRGATVAGTPVKSLLLLPERYRIACVDELGLIARAVVIWSKPNGLPESVTDRVRRSHEDWVHLTKQPRYFAAVDEIREAYTPGTAKRYAAGYNQTDYQTGKIRRDIGVDYSGSFDTNPLGKLPGSVWEIATQPLKVPAELGVDHFAAFPMEWPRRIILGWSPSGICVACGEGRRPVVDRAGLLGGDNNPHSRNGSRALSTIDGGSVNWARRMAQPDRIVGYACACTPYTDHPGLEQSSRLGDSRATGLAPRSRNGDVGSTPRTGPWREHHLDDWTPPPTRPAVVLDPFGGTGTTALMADVLGRHGISVDMSADYNRLAAWRTGDAKQRERALRPPKPRKPREDPPPQPQTASEWLAHFGMISQ